MGICFLVVKYNNKAQLKEIISYQIEVEYEAGEFDEKTYLYPDSKNHYSTYYYYSFSNKDIKLEDNHKHFLHIIFYKNGLLKTVNFYDKGKLLGYLQFNKNGSIVLPFN